MPLTSQPFFFRLAARRMDDIWVRRAPIGPITAGTLRKNVPIALLQTLPSKRRRPERPGRRPDQNDAAIKHGSPSSPVSRKRYGAEARADGIIDRVRDRRRHDGG